VTTNERQLDRGSSRLAAARNTRSAAQLGPTSHLLTNDTGSVWRHAYDLASGEPMPFRSGYVNVACDDETDRR
jgi:hypothetical protein